eukprot:g42369.t1
MYNVRIGEAILIKHVDHKRGRNKTYPEPPDQLDRLSEPVGSLLTFRIKENSEAEMDMADVTDSMPLPPEKEDEFLHLELDELRIIWDAEGVIERSYKEVVNPEGQEKGSWVTVRKGKGNRQTVQG